jgi:hypothetical protein
MPVPGPSNSTGHRQKIASIEYTISTTMPGEIGLEALKQFVEHILAAIEFLRTSGEPCKKRSAAISYLKKAKIPLQIAIDETRPGGNARRRYQSIEDVGQKLEEALNNW